MSTLIRDIDGGGRNIDGGSAQSHARERLRSARLESFQTNRQVGVTGSLRIVKIRGCQLEIFAIHPE
jgi:hypothetical protein